MVIIYKVDVYVNWKSKDFRFDGSYLNVHLEMGPNSKHEILRRARAESREILDMKETLRSRRRENHG